MKKTILRQFAVAAVVAVTGAAALAQQGTLNAADKQRRIEMEAELQSIAVVERKVMMPMPDGVRLATDIYRPKNATGKVPIIWVRTPYNFNFWDIQNGVPADMSAQLTAVKRGYAYVVQNERGHFFSEGNYDILGSKTDGFNTVDWLTKQPWSNGKIGTTGCSSTAEYQMGVAALGHPGYAAMNVQGFGAGVGRVGPYYEQGNWYRGGAVQMLFIAWLYGEQNQVRPMFPPNTSREDLIRASKSFDLAQHAAAGRLVEGAVASADAGHHQERGRPARHLRVGDAGRNRRQDDPARAERSGVVPRRPLSRRPEAERARPLVHVVVRRVGRAEPRALQPRAADGAAGDRRTSNGRSSRRSRTARTPAPRPTRSSASGAWATRGSTTTKSCTASSIASSRARQTSRLDSLPKVTYFTMGMNKWQTADTWPPAGAQPLTFYLSSGGKANTLNGDGALSAAAPDADKPDAFTYDPMNPVLSYGGNVCCTGTAVQAGAFDQRRMEAREDILVYTSEPFKEGTEVSGPITPTLYVSSDAKDTDFTVKVLDVYPDGRAFNLDESIQRMRYRDGYDKPLAWMESGKVYKATLQPLTTSNYFAAGHKLRIEVSSSNFPRFDRNLNTGGNNYDESKGVVAHNAVHHSKQYPSSVTVTIVKKSSPATAVQ